MSHEISLQRRGQGRTGVPMVLLAAIIQSVCGWLLAAGLPDPTASGLTLDDLVDGAAIRSQELSRAHMLFTMKCYIKDDLERPVLDFEYDLTKSGENELCTVQMRPSKFVQSQRIERASWDGRLGIGFSEVAEAEPGQRFSGSVLGSRHNTSSLYYPRVIAYDEPLDARMPLHQLMRQSDWRSLGKKEIGSTVACGAAGTDAKTGLLYEVWLVPDQGFAPVLLTERRANGTRSVEFSDVTLAQHEKRWLTAKGTVTVFEDDGVTWACKYQYELSRFSSQLPDDIAFSLKFPVGTAVWNEVTQTHFFAGKGVRVTDPATGFMHLAPIAELPECNALTDFTKGLSDAEWAQTPEAGLPVVSGVPQAIAEAIALVPVEAASKQHEETAPARPGAYRPGYLWAAALAACSAAGFMLWRLIRMNRDAAS